MGKKNPPVNEGALRRAIADILSKNSSVREAAKMFGLSKTSLYRHLTSHMTNSSRDAVNTPFKYQSKITHNKILTTEQETELKTYLIEASKLHYGLGIFEVKTLVYEYAKRNGISYLQDGMPNKRQGHLGITSLWLELRHLA